MHLCLPILTLLTFLLTSSLAARQSATSFCKCICFNNSTIIALNPPPSSSAHNTLLHHRSPLPNPEPNPDPSPKNNKHPHNTNSQNTTLQSTSQNPPSTHPLTCTDCNRAFCLKQNLPICASANEEDVFATCFQRDSLKDETVVVVFLIATVGLLGWALVKPWADRVRGRDGGMGLGGGKYGVLSEGAGPGARGEGVAAGAGRRGEDGDEVQNGIEVGGSRGQIGRTRGERERGVEI